MHMLQYGSVAVLLIGAGLSVTLGLFGGSLGPRHVRQVARLAILRLANTITLTPTQTSDAHPTARGRIASNSVSSSRSSKNKAANIARRRIKMKTARRKARGVEMNLMHDWIDRNAHTPEEADLQLYDFSSGNKRRDVRVDHVLEEFLRDIMIDLLVDDPRIAQLGEIAISRVGTAEQLHEHLLAFLDTYYADLSDEFLNQSSVLRETHEEGRHRSHEIFSAIAPCWIYEVKKSREYIADKVVEKATARKDMTEPQSTHATTDHLMQRTQREWRHTHDKAQVEAQLRQVLRLLTEGTASARLKESFRSYLFPKSWTTLREGSRLVISHEGSVLSDSEGCTKEARKNK